MTTPEKKAEELIFLGSAIFQALPDPHFIVDENHLIRHLNDAACQGFGYDHDELVGQNIEILVPEANRAKHVEYVKDYMRAAKMRPMGVGLAVCAKRKSGVLVPVEISLSPITRSKDNERRIIVRIVFKQPEPGSCA